MKRLTSLLVGLGGLALGILYLSIAGTSAKQAPQYPLDDKLAREPAPWTVPGKWGKRGNWGRWGEQDKRGMLNVITPEMIVRAASLVKTGKAYALGEELHDDVARVVRPARFGVQVIQELDGYDRVAATTGKFDPQRYQGAASFTVMHNHTGSHLDTFAHIYRENALYNNMPPPKPLGTVHGDAASVKFMVGRGVLLDVAKYKGQDPLPSKYWITLDDLQNTAKAQNVEIRKGDILLIRTGWRTARPTIPCPSPAPSCGAAASACRSIRFPSGDTPAITVHGVTKSFPLGDGRTLPVLDVEELTFAAGSCTVVKGRSGSGKTTLLNLIAGVSLPMTGAITVHDVNITALPEAERDRFRAQHVGYVFQTYNLLSAFSALENVMLAMMFAGAVPARDRRRRATDLLQRL